MGLQLWMPLTKDLRQQGLSGITPTQTTGYTSVAAGKLGGCYKFTGTFDTLLPLSNWNWTEGSVSFGCWAKISQSELATLVNAASYDATYNSMGGTLLGRDSYGGLGLRWKTNNIYSSSTLSAVYIYVHMRNTSSSANYTSNYTIPFDTWFHVMSIIDRNENKIKVYINGELFTSTNLTVTGSFNTGTFRIAEATWDGGNGRSSAGCWQLNDVRVYNHALSQMEVKEISKGLVLHYPLNRRGRGQENILLNTHFDSQYQQTTGWDTSLNGTQLASSWGGYNGGVTNPSTGYHAHLYKFNGEWVYRYLNENNRWLGISQSGLQSKLTVGETYIFSWEQYCVSGSNYATGGLYYYKTGASSASFHLGQFSGSSGRVSGKWQKFTYTFIAPSDGDYSKNMSWYVYGTTGGTGTFYVRHFKLEKGSVATPWCPNIADINNMSLDGTTEYDYSGFGNNGTRSGTFTWTSDTPKYQVSTYMSAAATISHTRCLDNTNQEWSCVAWVKPTTAGNYQNLNNFNESNRLYHGTYPLLYANSGTNDYYNYGNLALPANQWSHIVFVFKNFTGTKLIYINGENHTNTSGPNKTSTPKGIPDTVVIGGGNYEGGLCDYREYATALSADDVKSLYQNEAYIDASENIYGKIRD